MEEDFRNERRSVTYEFQDLKVDLDFYRIVRGSRTIDMGPTETRLLCILMEQPDRIFTREELFRLLWPDGRDRRLRNVDVYVGRLRRRLNRRGTTNLIRTIRTVGYSLH